MTETTIAPPGPLAKELRKLLASVPGVKVTDIKRGFLASPEFVISGAEQPVAAAQRVAEDAISKWCSEDAW